MGFFNETASVDAFAINAYCIASALFFSACAYAQLNDPNPVQWFCAYVFGGTVPNLYWMNNCNNKMHGGGSSSSSVSGNSTRNKLSLALRGFVALMVLAVLYKLAAVFPKLLAEVSEQRHRHGVLWAFLEHEEGRDSCGLLLLILHVSYLNSVLSRSNNGGSSPGSAGRPADSATTTRTAGTTTVVSPALVALGLFAVLGLCVYVWIVHHPDLVARHGLKHCQGEMFGRTGGEL
mmetsp:Transcript_55026/g.112349  ORF Transcript_55026/g.112349 Transcript_55026/m.112349 type:complete len:234 (+) Transcript_55026:109-810(+)